MPFRPSTARLRRPFSPPKSPSRKYATLFEDQPREPLVSTALPGPQSLHGRTKLSRVFDTGAMRMLVDYENSRGNLCVHAKQLKLLLAIADLSCLQYCGRRWQPLLGCVRIYHPTQVFGDGRS